LVVSQITTNNGRADPTFSHRLPYTSVDNFSTGRVKLWAVFCVDNVAATEIKTTTVADMADAVVRKKNASRGRYGGW